LIDVKANRCAPSRLKSATNLFLRIMHPIDIWHGEHVNFAKLLDLLDGQLVTLHAADRPDYELMRDIIYYLRHYSDRYHHPREDLVFALMLNRDPSLELIINRLLQEHRVIAGAGEEVRERVQQVLDDAVVPRASLEMALAVYITFYRHHLNTEESKIMPLAMKMLGSTDWDEINAKIPAQADPLFGDVPHARFSALRRHLTV